MTGAGENLLSLDQSLCLHEDSLPQKSRVRHKPRGRAGPPPVRGKQRQLLRYVQQQQQQQVRGEGVGHKGRVLTTAASYSTIPLGDTPRRSNTDICRGGKSSTAMLKVPPAREANELEMGLTENAGFV